MTNFLFVFFFKYKIYLKYLSHAITIIYIIGFSIEMSFSYENKFYIV